jgi:hypothetical protein
VRVVGLVRSLKGREEEEDVGDWVQSTDRNAGRIRARQAMNRVMSK